MERSFGKNIKACGGFWNASDVFSGLPIKTKWRMHRREDERHD